MAIRGTGSNTAGWYAPVGATTAASGLPLTIAAWVRTTVDTTFACLASSTDVQQIAAVWQSPWLFVDCYDAGGSSGEAGGGQPFSADGLWHHLAVRQTGLTPGSWDVFVDGTQSTGGFDFGTTLTAASFDRIFVGISPTVAFGEPTFSTSSSVAEVAVWSGGLINAEIAALATGRNPISVSRQRLRSYHPLRGNLQGYAPGNQVGLAPYGSPGAPVFQDHPPVEPIPASRTSYWLRPGGVTQTAAATLSGAGSLTAGVVPQRVTNATIAGAATATATANLIVYPRAAPTGVATVQVPAVQRMIASAAIPGTGAVVVDAIRVQAPTTPSSARIDGVGALQATGLLLERGTATISTTGGLIADTVLNRAATALLSGTAGISVSFPPLVAAATIIGIGGFSVRGRLRAIAAAQIDGAGRATAAVRLRASARSTLGGTGSLSAVGVSTGANPGAPGTIHLTGLRLILPSDLRLDLVAEADALALDATDLRTLPLAWEGQLLLLAQETGILSVPLDDGVYPMSLLHPVTMDPAERIFLKIDASALLAPSSETITAATFTPSSQATLDSHTLVASYYDAPNKALGFQPTGGQVGTQYAWTVSFNTTDVDARNQTRKRTILVSVVAK